MSRFRELPASFFRRPAETVAADLLGRFLLRRHEAGRLVLRIVETEAYLGAPDRASHAWNGRRTPRTDHLFRAGGHAYVYFVYGMHHLFNITTGSAADGSAVLVRAGAAIEGVETMARLRGLGGPVRAGALAAGPARLCRALAIDLSLNGVALGAAGPLAVTRGEPAPPEAVVAGPRVGVDYAGAHAAWPLRFAIAGHPEVSRPRPKAAG